MKFALRWASKSFRLLSSAESWDCSAVTSFIITPKVCPLELSVLSRCDLHELRVDRSFSKTLKISSTANTHLKKHNEGQLTLTSCTS